MKIFIAGYEALALTKAYHDILTARSVDAEAKVYLIGLPEAYGAVYGEILWISPNHFQLFTYRVILLTNRGAVLEGIFPCEYEVYTKKSR